MTDPDPHAAAVDAVADPTTAPFWRACCDRELMVQVCGTCETAQFYPRPFCLTCGSDAVAWTLCSGEGTVYSTTTCHVQVTPELPPPYAVALVDLEEGPRLLTNIVGEPAAIGDPVTLDWRERDGLPPLPVFRRLAE